MVNMIVQKIPGITLDEFKKQQYQQLCQMIQQKPKIERTKLGIFPAFQSSASIPQQRLKMFFLWAIVNDSAITFVFQSSASDYQKYFVKVMEMVKSFKPIKILLSGFELDTYYHEKFSFKYPSDWEREDREGIFLFLKLIIIFL